MTELFVYGTLRDEALLAIVLGRLPERRAARLKDHAVFWVAGRDFPIIEAAPGAVAEGLLLCGLTEQDVARLNYYEGPFGYHTRAVRVDAPEPVQALAYFPDPGRWSRGAAWSLAEWQAGWGAVVRATAGDVMAGYPAPIASERWSPMLVRGASRVRAGEPAPNLIRRQPAPGDVEVIARNQPYARFFAVEDYTLRFRRFDGSQSRRVDRAAFVSGDAVTVLPYDPQRDRVLIVEQFRTGPFARGDGQPWQLEAIAGRVDPFETPQEAARREAVEETGLVLGELIALPGYYPSPGAKTEFIYSYLALADLPDGTAIRAGAPEEAEDIQGHLLSFDDLMAAVASGEIATAPLILSAYWLERERPRIRAAAQKT